MSHCIGDLRRELNYDRLRDTYVFDGMGKDTVSAVPRKR